MGARVAGRLEDLMSRSEFLLLVGLALNLAGTVAIFFFGPPQPRPDPMLPRTALLWKEDTTLDEDNARIARLRRRHEFWSRQGLFLIALGFALQIVSVLL